jgi:hypothetical protein
LPQVPVHARVEVIERWLSTDAWSTSADRFPAAQDAFEAPQEREVSVHDFVGRGTLAGKPVPGQRIAGAGDLARGEVLVEGAGEFEVCSA